MRNATLLVPTANHGGIQHVPPGRSCVVTRPPQNSTRNKTILLRVCVLACFEGQSRDNTIGHGRLQATEEEATRQAVEVGVEWQCTRQVEDSELYRIRPGSE